VAERPWKFESSRPHQKFDITKLTLLFGERSAPISSSLRGSGFVVSLEGDDDWWVAAGVMAAAGAFGSAGYAYMRARQDG
jgi:hypothetical protein